MKTAITIIIMYVFKTLFKDAGSVNNLPIFTEGVKQFSYLQQRKRNEKERNG